MKNKSLWGKVGPMQQSQLSPELRDYMRHLLLDPCLPDEDSKPTVFSMAGIPGSGKSTFVKNALERRYFPKGSFILNPDLVMDNIPAYRADFVKLGAEEAFTRWELPARALAYDLAREASQKKIPIIKDMGLVRIENWRMLMDLRSKGYKVVIHHILCNADEAVRRCSERARHFPAQKIYERARDLDAFMVEFADVAHEVLRFDNSDLARPFVPLPSNGRERSLKSA
ncbi:MAG: hypothetical protein EBQ96_00845 [Proteobacteria bacterium]|nr:hypothetical protein [Pseudomonadota bacterium]